MKQEILAMTRPKPETRTEELRSSDNPDVSFAITVKRLTATELSGAEYNANGYLFTYITGYPLLPNGKPDKDNPKYIPPIQLPVIDGQVVQPTEGALRVLARIEVAQRQQDRYSIEDLIGLSVHDEIWLTLQDLDDWLMPVVLKGVPEGNSGAHASKSVSGTDNVIPS